MQKGAFTQGHSCKRKIIRKARKPNHVFLGRVGVSTAIYFEVGLKLARCLLTNWIHFFFSRWSRLQTVASLCRSVFGILAALLIWRTGNAILIFHNDAHLSQLLSAMLSPATAHKLKSRLWVMCYLTTWFKYHFRGQNSQTTYERL